MANYKNNRCLQTHQEMSGMLGKSISVQPVSSDVHDPELGEGGSYPGGTDVDPPPRYCSPPPTPPPPPYPGPTKPHMAGITREPTSTDIHTPVSHSTPPNPSSTPRTRHSEQSKYLRYSPCPIEHCLIVCDSKNMV